MIKNIKKTRFWKHLISFLILPIFKFFWKNIINLHGRILYFFYFKRGHKQYSEYFLKNDDKKIIRNVSLFKEITEEINKNLTEEFLLSMKKKIVESKFPEGHYLSKKENFKIDMFQYLNSETRKKIFNFALSDLNLNIVSNYFGVMPVISNLYLSLNVPVEGEKERGSMLWHRDGFGFKCLDLFIPIRKLNEDNGPLFYQKKINKMGVFHRYTDVLKNAKEGERNKIAIAAFENNQENNIDYFSGNVGDGIFLDSFSCYHRGGFCKKNDRLMLRITYQTPDSTAFKNPNSFKNISSVDDLEKIKNNLDIFKKYSAFKRSKLFSILHIQEILLKFYGLMHFKDDKAT